MLKAVGQCQRLQHRLQPETQKKAAGRVLGSIGCKRVYRVAVTVLEHVQAQLPVCKAAASGRAFARSLAVRFGAGGCSVYVVCCWRSLQR